MFTFTGVDVGLELGFCGLKREDVRLVRTGGEAVLLLFSNSLVGEFIINRSAGGVGVLMV